MNRRPVSSSHVASVGWEETDEEAGLGTLEVEFRHKGSVYRYAEVPERVYQELVGSSSIGKHLYAHVLGRYEEQKV